MATARLLDRLDLVAVLPHWTAYRVVVGLARPEHAPALLV